MQKDQRSPAKIATKACPDPHVLDDIVRIAVEEDLGEAGDITSDAIIDPSFEVRAQIHGEETGVIAGVQVASKVFHFLDSALSLVWELEDGDQVRPNTLIATIEGRAKGILAAERTALNFLQHMSGIATFTSQFVERIKPYPVKILDTRKTTPGIRVLEKYAVILGGGYNHRLGLYDAVLIKENHVRAVGGIRRAISLVRQSLGQGVQVEIETENLDEVEEALEAKADIIMLDNMDLDSIKKAVRLVEGRAVLEVSGGVRLGNIEDIAKTGVDLISTSELTQSALSLDMSLEII
jgi:nicotinate-nucleotide pyrophosphorylase (carboxylating)